MNMPFLVVLIVWLPAVTAISRPGPFDGLTFHGRIAFSSDGNFNDEDDWGAFPVAVAMLETFGVVDRLVHVDYNNILPQNGDRFYREMTESVLGAAKRFGVSADRLFDCQTNLNGAIRSILDAVNASSAENPLYYILAGPMEVPYRGIEQSDPEKRKHVYCISHNIWNDGYASADLVDHNKRDLIPTGVRWIQIRDGNRLLAFPGGVGKSSTPAQWKGVDWMRTSPREELRWIFGRLKAEGRVDFSDACMTYFLLTGDEDANLDKVRGLLADRVIPPPTDPRASIRLEAENFRVLDGVEVEYVNDRKASKRMSVRGTGEGAHRIKTSFFEPYTAVEGMYDIEVRLFDRADAGETYGLLVQGRLQGRPWRAPGAASRWVSHTLHDVPVRAGDSIAVEVSGPGSGSFKLDYIQLVRR